MKLKYTDVYRCSVQAVLKHLVCSDIVYKQTVMYCVAGVIVFDFSGVKDNGQVMKSDEARDKMQLMAQPMATFHKELKLGEAFLFSLRLSAMPPHNHQY